jgi:hypothetical protein
MHMKSKIIAGITLLLLASAAHADTHPGEYFSNEKVPWAGELRPQIRSPFGSLPRAMPAKKEAVARIVAREAQARLGSQWVKSALKLAQIESSYNCAAVGPRTRHGHARGVLQVLPSSARALGYDPSRLNECDYGVRVGIAHMAACIRSGVTTHAQMAACHVSGTAGWQRKLSARAEKYRREYVHLAMR